MARGNVEVDREIKPGSLTELVSGLSALRVAEEREFVDKEPVDVIDTMVKRAVNDLCHPRKAA